MSDYHDDDDDLVSLAPALEGRLWDLSDGRLADGRWMRFGGETTLLSFSASVEEFQAAMEAELSPRQSSPGVAEGGVGASRQGDFIRELREQEAMRDRQERRKSAPVVGFYAGSLTGVTAPMWEVVDESNTRHEFTSEGDAKRFKKEVLERIKVNQRYQEVRKTGAIWRQRASFKHVTGVSPSSSGDQRTPSLSGQGGAGAGAGGGGEDTGDVVDAAAKMGVEVDDEVKKAFDCYASIGVGATRQNARMDDLKNRLRDIVDGKVHGEISAQKQTLRSHVQDAVQVFAQTIEEEDAIMVCDFMNCVVEKAVKAKTSPKLPDTGNKTDIEFAKKEHELFSSKLLSFDLLKNEPVCMLGLAIKRLRPLKPRVVVVTPRSAMVAALQALRAAAGDGEGVDATHTQALKSLYPALGWVVVPDGRAVSLFTLAVHSSHHVYALYVCSIRNVT